MADSAWTIVSRIGAGLLLYTGLGWLASRWVGNPSMMMAIGAVIGLVLSMYLVIAGLNRERSRQSGIQERGK